MVSFYKIINKKNNRETEFNEITLLKIIAVLKDRNIMLYNLLIEIYEQLEGEKFNKELLK